MEHLTVLPQKLIIRQTVIPVVVFNGLNWRRDDPVTFECSFNKGEAYGVKILDQDKKTINSQLTEPAVF